MKTHYFTSVLKGLSGEMATHRRYRLFQQIQQILPDPDPILQKIGKSVEVYRDLTSDPHVFANIQQRKSAVTSLRWRIQYTGVHTPLVKFVTDTFAKLETENIISQVLNAVYYGYVIMEIVWKKSDGLWMPERIEEKPQEWFFFNDENRPCLKNIRNGGGTILPENKFLLVRNSPTYQNPYGEKALSRCYWPVMFKRSGQEFWLLFIEKYGIPFLVAKQPRAYTEAESKALLDALTAMMEDTVGVIPDDSSVGFVEGSKTYTSDVFRKFVEFCNSEISKALLSQTLTTEVQNKGTYSASVIHSEALRRITTGDKRLVENALNRLIRIIAEVNFTSDETEVLPVFSLYNENEIHKNLAERDRILRRQGVTFSRDYYKRRYGFTDDDFDG